MLKHSRSVAIVALLSLVSGLAAPSASAQAPAADPTLAAAHARFEEGVRFFDKQQFENARAAFLQAYALHKHPAVLINLAQSSLRAGHTLEADRFFTRYLRESSALTPAQRAEAEKGLAEARAKLGRIDVLAPAGTAVTIDGELAGTDGSTTLDVEPGAHAVKGGTDSSSVTVAAGQTVMVKLGKPAATAVVPVIAPPVPAAEIPPAPPPPPPPPAEEPAAQSSSIFSRPATMAPIYVGIATTVVGFGSAIIFAVFKGNATDAYNGQVAAIQNAVGFNSQGACVNPKAGSTLAQGCSALNGDASDVSNDATAANVALGVGIVGAAFTVVWYLAAPKAADKPSSAQTTLPTIQPLFGPHLGGLALGASF
jgi:hypothetical protein